MAIANLLMSASGGSATEKLYSDDVFSCYLYTGNGSTQTINNGIDLASKGGMVWIKGRSYDSNNNLTNTVSGVNKYQISNITDAALFSTYALTNFNSNGFSVGSNSYFNQSSQTYVSWTFRKAPKFFDVVTWTGDGTTRAIPHSLGGAPGLIVVKKISGTNENWHVWHKSLSNPNNSSSGLLYLNTTDAELAGIGSIYVTSNNTSTFTVSSGAATNANGATYVAYLFAHDPSADGIIQAGSFTGGTTPVNLGWEPQWLLTKRVDSPDNWILIDSMRGMPVGSSDQYLSPNLNASESSYNLIEPNALGFTPVGFSGGAATYIYLAIRRPNKPPTSGTQVFAPFTSYAQANRTESATGANGGFDLVLGKNRGDTSAFLVADKLRGISTSGANLLNTTATSSESFTAKTSGSNYTDDGISLYSSNGGVSVAFGTLNDVIGYAFKRAPGFMDVVAYTGTGSGVTAGHNLGTVPEMIIIADRDGGFRWGVGHRQGGLTTWSGAYLGALNSSAAMSYNSQIVQATTTSFTAYQAPDTTSGHRYIAYLFAALPGVSKVGSYTGNGSTLNVDCGFSGGARFVLIKRTDAAGDWYVWDTARGIVAASDPHLSLNTTAAEVTTDDSIDPYAAGFAVNQNTATNINVSNATYIYLSIA